MNRKYSQSILLYCEDCQKETKHYKKSLKCRNCSVKSFITYQECPNHGRSAFIGGHCYSCKSFKTVKLKNCGTHGVVKHQGDKCCQCINSSHKFTKKYCQKCQKDTTHQRETCMSCSKSGWAAGQYSTKKECYLSFLEDCEKIFERKSGAQKLCQGEHKAICTWCGNKAIFNAVKYSEERALDFVKTFVCSSCISEAILFGPANRISRVETICEFYNSELISTSTCFKTFVKTNSRQKRCLGSHVVLCQLCQLEEVALTASSYSRFKKNKLYCYSCSRKSFFSNKYCEKCGSSTVFIGKYCCQCRSRAFIENKYCSICQKITNHMKNTCYNCSSRKNAWANTECSECRELTETSKKGLCKSCIAKSILKKKHCDNCKRETTHSKNGSCLSCRNFKKMSRKYCEIHGESVFNLDACMTCGWIKGRETFFENYKQRNRGTNKVFQSEIELRFLEKLSLNPGVVAGFIVDGVDVERKIVFEYDGWYWHKDKIDKDCEKTVKFLENGYRVIRVREGDLRNKLQLLPLSSSNLLQVEFLYDREIPESLIESIREFIDKTEV